MMDILEKPSVKSGGTALLGDIYALDPECELMKLILASDLKHGTGSVPLQIQDCRTLSGYKSLALRDVLITRSPLASMSVRQTARRIGGKASVSSGCHRVRRDPELSGKYRTGAGNTPEEAGIDPENGKRRM